MSVVRVPGDLLRPVVQAYVDKYETGEMDTQSRAKLSPLDVLAAEADYNARSLRRLLARKITTIDFDRADRIMCAMGYGVYGWLYLSEELSEFYRGLDLTPYEPKPKREAVKRACGHCGEPFTSTRPEQKFCTVKCRSRSRYTPYVPTPKPCQQCGKEYTPKRPVSRYCSHRCMHKADYHKQDAAERRRKRKERYQREKAACR